MIRDALFTVGLGFTSFVCTIPTATVIIVTFQSINCQIFTAVQIAGDLSVRDALINIIFVVASDIFITPATTRIEEVTFGFICPKNFTGVIIHVSAG